MNVRIPTKLVTHTATLKSLSDLSLVLEIQGKHEAAEEINRRGLEGYGKALGTMHLWTLVSMNNLAMVLRDQRNSWSGSGDYCSLRRYFVR